jgi:hypothetical protein
MASSLTNTAAHLGRKLVNRAETVVGDDWREAKKRANDFVRSDRAEFRRITGGSNRSPRKRASSQRRKSGR